MGSSLLSYQEKEFIDFQKSKKDGLVIFSAPWCAACKLIVPKLEELAKTHDKIPFIKIDVSKNPGLASRMGVMSLPNILFISKGRIIDQIIGSTTKSVIEQNLKKLIKK